MIEADQRARQRGIVFGIVVPEASAVFRTLKIAGLLDFLPVYPTMAEALSSMPVGQSQ
jgi:hypothetical protein